MTFMNTKNNDDIVVFEGVKNGDITSTTPDASGQHGGRRSIVVFSLLKRRRMTLTIRDGVLALRTSISPRDPPFSRDVSDTWFSGVEIDDSNYRAANLMYALHMRTFVADRRWFTRVVASSSVVECVNGNPIDERFLEENAENVYEKYEITKPLRRFLQAGDSGAAQHGENDVKYCVCYFLRNDGDFFHHSVTLRSKGEAGKEREITVYAKIEYGENETKFDYKDLEEEIFSRVLMLLMC